MTIYKDPKEHPPTPGVEYWVMREDLEPFKALRDSSSVGQEDFWKISGFGVNDDNAGIIQYTEIKPPPPPVELDSFTQATKLIGLVAFGDKNDSEHGIITEFLSDLAANIRADEHDRCNDFYVKFDQAAVELAQHERTITTLIKKIEPTRHPDPKTEADQQWQRAVNNSLSVIKNMEKP